MTSRYDIAALRKLAGHTIFARGEATHREGRVRIVALDGTRVLARVEGNESHRVEFDSHAGEIDGQCTCAAFTSSTICKHMVAVALAADGLAPDDEAAATMPRIRAHLKARGIDALVDMIMQIAERDSALFEKLDLAATAVDADEATLEARLAAALDDATDVQDLLFRTEGVGSWADRVDTLLDAVADLVDTRAALAMRLVERALDAVMPALESIDDEEGEGITLLERMREIHLAAATRIRPEPIDLASDLYAREMSDDYGIFSGAATAYAEVLGDASLAAYRALAEAEWVKLPPRTANDRAHEGDYGRLASILDDFAARDNDIAARIALRTKDLSTQADYLHLARFCREHTSDVEALRWAEEGLWIFEDGRQEPRLTTLTVELLVGAGRTDEAVPMLWTAFRKAPSLDLYDRLRKLRGEARDEAIAFLNERARTLPASAYRSPADLLVQILQRETMLDAAWAAAREHVASRNVTRALADATEQTHPAEALAVHVEHVEELIGISRYEMAVALIARMAGLRDGAEHGAYVAALKERHKRKRNLMKLLA